MRYARLRFASGLAAAASGATLAVGAFTFGAGTERWLGLAVGAGILALTVFAFATAARGTLQRVLDVLLVPICAWTLVSSRTLALMGHGDSVGLVKWLGFSAGAAIASIGVISLIAHELSMESDMRWAIERFSTHSTFRRLEDDDGAHAASGSVEAEEWG